MKKKWIARLRSKAGETIAETLIATLIAALALTMLAGAIGSAARIINTSRDAMKDYRGSGTATEEKWSELMDDLGVVEGGDEP